jgi:hypothetical protein
MGAAVYNYAYSSSFLNIVDSIFGTTLLIVGQKIILNLEQAALMERMPITQKGADGIYRTADDGLNLQTGSTCVGAGNPNANNLPTSDITGAARTANGAINMGSYELLKPPPPTFV